MEKVKISLEKMKGHQSSKKGFPSTEEKKICDIHGEYNKFFDSPFGKLRERNLCPKCKDEQIKQRDIEQKEADMKARIESYHIYSNVPKRFKGLDINKINLSYHKAEEDNGKLQHTVRTVKGYLNTYEERLKNGASGFFSGECGTGKTMLACMMVEDIINKGHSAHYVTAWQMIQEIRQGYKKGIDESIKYFIDQYIKKSFLVIDEIGVQHGTEDERILLYQVIDGRYNEVKPTVLISNSKNPVEDGYLDLRTIDRLKEGGGFSITFTGESFRK